MKQKKQKEMNKFKEQNNLIEKYREKVKPKVIEWISSSSVAFDNSIIEDFLEDIETEYSKELKEAYKEGRNIANQLLKECRRQTTEETIDKIKKEFNNSLWFHNNETAFAVLSMVINNLKKDLTK